MTLGYEFSETALEDVGEIYSFYRRVFAEDTAQARVDEIFHRVKEVVAFPNSGTPVPSRRQGVRRIIQRDYLIFYVVRDETVFVLRVVHGRRDLTDLKL